MKEQEFEENALSTLVAIEHIKQNDFESYMETKSAFWANILAVISGIFQGSIFEIIGLSKITSLCIVMIIFTVFLLIMRNTIRRQHNQLEYLNFKMLCINTIKHEKEKQMQNANDRNKKKN